MSIHIPEDILQQAGISEGEALIELACHLFDTGKLSLFFAAKLARLSPADFEDLLLERRIAVYRYAEDDLKSDLRTMEGAEE